MKTKIQLIINIIIISIISINCYGQKSLKKSNLEKLNLKQIESQKFNKEKRDKESNNIIRAKYNENFVDTKHNDPKDIALSYLKEKSAEFGLSENLENVEIKKISRTPGGKYVYFEQQVDNIPVYSTTSLIALNKGDTITYMLNNFRDLKRYKDYSNKAKITESDAIDVAKNYLNIQGKVISNPKSKLIFFESNDIGLELAWQINIVSMAPLGDWLVVINAINKRIIHVKNRALNHNGSGMVYLPNPVTTGETEYGGNYVDNNDANNATLANERVSVTLRDITYDNSNNTYKLEGPYCVLEDIETPNDEFPELANPNGFNFTRDQQEFEAVMVYYHIDLASRRVESLGYNVADLKTFSSDPHGLDGDDNSHYIPSLNYIAFGEGGVDDAEDADVIWHEYAHAFQENLGAGDMIYEGESMAVQEGSSDYWAVSYKRSLSSYHWNYVFNWDGYNEFWEGRNADIYWVYPDDYPPSYLGEHVAGQIWSSALMDIWDDLGRDITDRLFLETHFLWGTSPSMVDAAEAFMQADWQLYNGSHICTILQHFNARGLSSLDINLVNKTISQDLTVTDCGGNINVQNVEVNNNSKLTINATNNVNIIGDFEIELGSELEIP